MTPVRTEAALPGRHQRLTLAGSAVPVNCGFQVELRDRVAHRTCMPHTR